MNKELKEFLIEMFLEFDGAGLVITDQDLLEEYLEKFSEFIENNIQIKESK